MSNTTDPNTTPITSNSANPLDALAMSGGTSTSTVVDDPLYSSLVGEGKKFRTKEDLARGKAESDNFIQKLQEENNALRALIRNADESKRSTEVLSDILERVSKGTLVGESINNESSVAQVAHGNQSSNEHLTSRDVELVYKRMRQTEVEDRNEREALSKVTAQLGDKTDEFLKRKADDLGLDVAIVKGMARKSPNAFLALMGMNNSNSRSATITTPRGSANSTAIVDTHGDTGVRNKKYYDKIKSEKGVKAFVLDRDLQVQMHKDMQALGDRWDSAD